VRLLADAVSTLPLHVYRGDDRDPIPTPRLLQRPSADFPELADFCRAYMNWWPSEIPADWLIITEADWRILADPDSTMVDPVAFAADVTPERSHAAIATAGLRPDGLGHAKVVDHRPGTGWSSGA
jgi:hypothetical protein